MPPSRLSTGSSSSSRRRQSGFTSTPAKTIQIPLNDDTAEKAKRHKRRTILQDMQMNKIAAAVTPGRRVTIGDRGESPLNTPARGEGPLDAVTPMRKVPILANFEEWMKLATDNKINATNSWNFALIDYFYDMSLLKEGEGINFQKASCTLDGCVKIYTNRVDSVATETGKLLSGLADSTSRKKGRGGDDEEEGSDVEAEEDGEGVKKPRRKAQRSSEATLAKDFHTLQIKKLELEFSVDPLFKKASADFDEGGAKGLLLNHLSIDSNGKIVFDSSDDKKAEEEEEIKEEDEDEDATPKPAPAEEKVQEPEDDDIPIDISVLASRFFPDLSRLDNQDICPSLKGFEFGDSAGALDIPFLKALEERADEELQDGGDGASDDGGDMAFGFDDGYGVGVEGDGLGFGEGGEVWANETIADAAERFMSPAKRPTMMGLGGADGEEERFGEVEGDFRVGFGDSAEGILSYFDEALKKNWAGPEHWRIRKIKDNTKSTAPVRVRKEKETFEIDFMDPAADIPAEVFAPPKVRGATTMTKKDQQPKSRYLLPDDKLFNSRQLLKLFLKPKSSIQETKRRRLTLGGSGRAGGGNTTSQDIPGGDNGDNDDIAGEDMDEEFWAKENMAMEIQASSTPDPKVAGNYDANFFQDDDGMGIGLGGGAHDDDDDDDEFADAREAFSPGPDGAVNPALAPQNTFGTQFPPGTFGGNLEFGSQLVTGARRVRPEYVQYARVAKKVDVRKLKENLWTGLAFEGAGAGEGEVGRQEEKRPEEPRMFTRVMNDLQSVYPQKTMADISTSYCFICLLHLANEKGLVITGSEALTELSVVKDESAEEPDGY